MAKHKLTPEQFAAVEELAERRGKIVARRADGGGGPDLDVDFDQMEQIAAAVSRGPARGTLEQLTRWQAGEVAASIREPAGRAGVRRTRTRRRVTDGWWWSGRGRT